MEITSENNRIAKMLLDICENENIHVYLLPTEKISNSGCAFESVGEKIIVLDEAIHGWEKFLTLAHETAHHIFGHLSKLENGRMSDACEDEARIFSAVFTTLAIMEAIKGENNSGAGQED